jgi:hypothetical protein
MASITFFTGGYGIPISPLNGSGLGFFAAGGFGTSVPVGSWSSSMYVTDGNGVNRGPQGNSVQYFSASSGYVQSGTLLNLQSIPNYQSSLNIHFNNATPVKTQNAKLYIYDRVNISNLPSGCQAAVCNIVHPDVNQSFTGSGNATWQFPAGSSFLPLSVLSNGAIFSPGQSGLSPNGGATIDQNHDFFVAISLSPNSIGSKLPGLYVSLEYL